MNCPFCQHSETKVSDSRPDPAGQSIRRRRECLQCGKRWRTLERIEDEMPLVVKRNNTHQPFSRDKLLNSLKVACGKRPVSMNQLDQIVAEIEWSILESGAKEISTVKIGEKIMAALKATDEIAYVRYASVYRRFKDVGELMAEMQQFVN
jgi:transcriptional repressor NrdR